MTPRPVPRCASHPERVAAAILVLDERGMCLECYHQWRQHGADGLPPAAEPAPV